MARKASAPELFPPPQRRSPLVIWPHGGWKRRGRDPRLTEFLVHLGEIEADGDHDHEDLLRCLAAGAWWCQPAQATAVAACLRRVLSDGP